MSQDGLPRTCRRSFKFTSTMLHAASNIFLDQKICEEQWNGYLQRNVKTRGRPLEKMLKLGSILHWLRHGAKCITNCAQINKILTDAALLKLQKSEIEELRMKLEYESECEKLKSQLEEVRAKQKDQEKYIKEQQLKIVSLNNRILNSDFKANQSE
ncbi:unnamed protein product, partial [Eruca vesicaria subsp. sativa]|nr:unnamed protein product [Eruca vesicaria subsp. sativa]